MNNTDCRNKSLWSACWDKAEEWFLSLQVPLAYISCIWPAPSLCPYISISGKTEAWIVRSVFCKRRSGISMLHSPAVNLLSSPRSRTKSKPSVWPFPSLCAEKVNSQLPCQQMLFPNSLSVLENFSPLFVQRSKPTSTEVLFPFFPRSAVVVICTLYFPSVSIFSRMLQEDACRGACVSDFLPVVSFSSHCHLEKLSFSL